MDDGPGDRETVAEPWGIVCVRPSCAFRAGVCGGGGARPVEVATLKPVGELASTRARQLVPDDRAYDFELAVNEVATNAIERADGGTFFRW